jgi:cytochrome c
MKPSTRAAGALMLATSMLAIAVSCRKEAPQTAASPAIGYDAHVAAGGVAPPAGQPVAPPPRAASDVTAGQGLFSAMSCDGCHGGGAVGWVGPSLVDGRWRYGGGDRDIFQSIFYGRPKGMPAYGGVLGADGVWMIVRYLEAQPVPAVVPTSSYADLASTAMPTAPAPVRSESQATDPSSRLAKYGCTACHSVDMKVVGPSFKDVAARYKGRGDAAQMLEQKIRDGGAGAWGDIPMPPNPAVPDAELHAIVQWVLTR